MQALTRFSLRNPVAVLLLALLVVAGGILSALRLNEELMPDIALPVIAVVTPYPGASPQEVADHVSKPIEDALRGLGDVKNVTSSSMQNVSEVELELNLNANLDDVQQKVHETLQQVKLPEGAMTPTVKKFSFNAQPVVYFTVASARQDERALRDAVHDLIVPALQGVPGVASVQTAGGAPDEVRILVSQDKLRQHHLTLEQVLQAIQASNVTMPLGTATLGGQVQAVQMAGAVRSLDDIRNIRIPLPADPSAGLPAIGESIGQMGQAVGQVAQGLGQVGQGLAVVQGETQILAALQQIQGQIWGTQLALAQEQARPPGAQSPQRVAELTGTLQALQREQDALNQRLKSLQEQLPPASASSPRPSATPKAPAAPSAAETASVPSSLDSVRLGDIADVTLAPPKDGAINRTDGQPSVMVSVLKAEDANTVQMADGVNAQLADLSKRLPAGVHIVPLFDSSTMIRSSIGGMLREAVLGALFAAAVILLFLRNWRTTVIAVVSIPLSLMCAIILLHQLNITLNIMTLGGMAVATGRVVDDSIVVIENIYRHWRQHRGEGKALALAATREVGAAITASTITTIAVFLPLGFVSGIVGKIFLPFALTVVCALASSLLVALTVVPLLAWLLVLRAPESAGDAGGPAAERTPERAEDTAMDAPSAVSAQGGPADGQRPLRPWQRAYQRFLNTCLNHKAAVLTVTAVAFVGSVLILPLAGSTFIPESREKFATIQVEMPFGTPRDATDAKARQVEQVVRSFGDTVQQMNTQVGSDAGQTDSDGSVRSANTASLFLELKPDTDVPAFVAKLRDKLKAIAPPADIQVKELILGGASGSFGVVVTGSNPDHIAQAADAITDALDGLPGLANVQNNLARTQPQVNIQPDPAKAAPYGLTAYAIASQVRAALAGEDAGQATLDGRTYAVVLTLQGPRDPQKLEDIRSFQLETPTGQRIALSDVATVQEVQAPVTVLHRNGAAFAEVTGDFTDQNTGRTTKLAMQRIQSLALPADVNIQLAGDAQEQNDSFRQLVEATVIAAGLVYLVMLVSFGEWTAPFAILFSMPVALIGAFAGTVIARQPVSVSSLIGILMLMGIVVTNAIVLVDRVERQRRQGLGVREALLEAGTTRLRPILMTAIATICALIPLALGFAEGALISQGLAVVVIGGLISSTALTLVVVPVVYEILHRRARRRESLAMRPNFG
ncbi:MAG: efflux RND transporter permease subunit [Alicyclobacillus macrosporangiidus]|uniref:efflux RND transporter permease subunit n=1 Tax=Alicyclobacillus macrosporangiidus TaxID=392015 RepID=UPI0026EAD109|nr:efflux RND transporter permease subunit [Alicyclobacillus macrosporangiidus]MCL6597257.1 efflux RND transporter permease subunit [Alicyclobacillus macrosporangiidus]